VLVQFYGVAADKVPLYGLAFAVGNLCGPLLLGPLFDSVGRKPMISGTYIISGVLLAISGLMFDKGHLDATTQTFCWIVIFFFASAGASAAYLTVSETWPILGGIVELAIGIKAEGKSLEAITKPITSTSEPATAPA
jgi:MFS family permease